MAGPKTVFKSTSKKPSSQSPMVDFPAGETIFREGDLGTEMFIVHEGQVEILKSMPDGDRPLAQLEKGDFFGEMAILEDLPRAASARAVTAVKLLLINGTTFDQMLRTNPEIAVRMMRKLSRRLRETDRLLRDALDTSKPSAAAPELAALPIDLPAPATPAEPPAGAKTQAGAMPVTVAPAAAERLLHEKSGMEFALAAGSETTIGRKDPVTGIDPEVDLTPVDTQRSISRRHAKIYRRGEKFFLCEEIGTMNGTFANGARLETGVPTEIRFGDEVRCGLVSLRFGPAA